MPPAARVSVHAVRNPAGWFRADVQFTKQIPRESHSSERIIVNVNVITPCGCVYNVPIPAAGWLPIVKLAGKGKCADCICLNVKRRNDGACHCGNTSCPGMAQATADLAAPQGAAAAAIGASADAAPSPQEGAPQEGAPQEGAPQEGAPPESAAAISASAHAAPSPLKKRSATEANLNEPLASARQAAAGTAAAAAISCAQHFRVAVPTSSASTPSTDAQPLASRKRPLAAMSAAASAPTASDVTALVPYQASRVSRVSSLSKARTTIDELCSLLELGRDYLRRETGRAHEESPMMKLKRLLSHPDMDLTRPNLNRSNAHSPIHIAVDKGHYEALPLLLERWPRDRPFPRADKGKTPLVRRSAARRAAARVHPADSTTPACGMYIAHHVCRSHCACASRALSDDLALRRCCFRPYASRSVANPYLNQLLTLILTLTPPLHSPPNPEPCASRWPIQP